MVPARPKTGVVGFRRLPAVGLLFCLLTPILHAEPRVLTDLSLEELANIRLTATSVMGIHHTHPKREWMVSYMRMQSRMAGNRSGTARLSDNEVLNDFMVAPTSMGSALAAKELNGSLVAESDGPGCGSTFTLELPLAKTEAFA